MRKRAAGYVAALSLLAAPIFAQQYQDGGEWITKWYGLELVTATGGFAASALVDYIDEGTGGAHTYESVSTLQGLGATKDMVVDLPNNGGDLTWEIVEIDPLDGNNMSTAWGLADQTNITWHSIIVIKSDSNQDVTANPAHDDHAQIWLNGELVYDNPCWTGGVQIVTRPTDFSFVRGDNVLLFKCGESGGSDYINLFFDASLDVVPTEDDKFFEVTSLAVDPEGKMSTTWADLKLR